MPTSHFYSRPCGRGDLHICGEGRPCRISTHAPAGGATAPAPPRLRGLWALFLLTPLREGRHDRRPVCQACLRNFYSRPCGRGDRGAPRNGRARAISTHAPAGGATSYIRKISYRLGNYFYSRPCGRGDLYRIRSDFRNVPISTHAPAGGATGAGWTQIRPSGNFYSRPCGRGDEE